MNMNDYRQMLDKVTPRDGLKDEIISQCAEKPRITHSFSKRKLAPIFAAAVIAAATPATIFAYEAITSKIEKTAKYENTLTIQTPVSNPISEFMNYEFGWLPDGYAYAVDNWGYDNTENGGRIAPLFYRLPDDTSLEISLPFSVDYETYKSDGKTAFINYKEANVLSFDTTPLREIFISFDNTSYVLDITISDDISEEEMLKLIDNTKLVPTDEICYGTYIPWIEEANITYEYEEKAIAAEENVRHIGDTISYPFSGVGMLDGFDVTLNSVEHTDSFDGINTDACGDPKDYSELMDENGNIIENTRQWIKHGDGINTTDEIISEEILPMHIVKVNVTYTNTSDLENEITISPIMFIKDNGEATTHWESAGEYSAYDSITEFYSQSNFFSVDVAPEYKGEKNAVILQPGESTDVQIAFFVDDNVKDKINLSFRVNTTCHSTTSYTSDFGEHFDISQ